MIAGLARAPIFSPASKRSATAPHNFLLVGNGGYATIQAAVDAAASGDTILIAAGTYSESLTVNTSGLTLVGLGEVVLQGTLRSANGNFTGTVADFLKAAVDRRPTTAVPASPSTPTTPRCRTSTSLSSAPA